MKIKITESQFKRIQKIVKSEVEEQESPSQITDTSSETKSSSYPDVGKWESGAVRGVANQTGNTKWSDIINITRGKANPLK
jgi:hypothetical protein